MTAVDNLLYEKPRIWQLYNTLQNDIILYLQDLARGEKHCKSFVSEAGFSDRHTGEGGTVRFINSWTRFEYVYFEQ